MLLECFCLLIVILEFIVSINVEREPFVQKERVTNNSIEE
jgi:hypothetical protein